MWILRWLLRGGGFDNFVSELGFSSASVAQALGVMPMNRGRRRKFRVEEIHEAMTRELAALEANRTQWVLPEPLRSNIERLASVVSFSQVECKILAFALQIHGVSGMTEAVKALGAVSRAKLPRVLASIFEVGHNDIRKALRSDGALHSCGLVQMSAPSSLSWDLNESLDFLSGDFVDVMLNGRAEPIKLLAGRVQQAPAPTLELDAFDQTVPALRQIVLPILRGATDSQRKGVNFLFIGPPGLGKSEAARMLASEVGAMAYEVASEDTDGNELTGSARIRAMKAGQLLLRGSRALMIFDEASDAFITREGLAWTSHRDMPRKAFLNQALEDNHIPGIWISNSPPTDPAVLRRFAGVFEFTAPREEVRRTMLTQLFSSTISEQTVRSFARSPNLSTAVVRSACAAVEGAGDFLGADDRNRTVHALVAAQLRVGFGERLPPLSSDDSGSAEDYDPALVNADHDLEALAASLETKRCGRILLAGPPGCGKTGFAAWTARRLGAPLQIVRMSSLLDMYVGETEKAIAAAFEKASQDGAVLCFDEIEGLLRPRSRAERSHEVTRVGELLVALERFEGVLIASTNLFDEHNIEPAALRRFDLIVEMKSSTPEQLMTLLSRTAHALCLPEPSEKDFKRIRSLDLTPGDFATVKQRARLLPFASPGALVDALEKTSCRKQPDGGKRAIGFTARVIAGT